MEHPPRRGIQCAKVHKFVEASDQLPMAAGTAVAGLTGTHNHTGPYIIPEHFKSNFTA